MELKDNAKKLNDKETEKVNGGYVKQYDPPYVLHPISGQNNKSCNEKEAGNKTNTEENN